MNLRDRKVAVIGLGRSGMAASRLLLEKGARVSLTDCLDNQTVRENARNLNKHNILTIELGRHSKELVQAQDLVVLSPGVSEQALPVVWAREKGIPVIGEIELAFAFCPAPVIAITGTNGKTTVSILVGEVFANARSKCVVCGNIGIPFSAEVGRLTRDYVVILEVSSFQLESIDRFRPKVAVVLNLTPDHLDRYKDIDEYLQAKARIFSNQGEQDWSLLNKEDASSSRLAQKTRAQLVYFSNGQDQDARLKGLNSNHFAVMAICSLFNIPTSLTIETCRNFKGVAHRIEKVAQIQGVEFINDSKATNVHSTLWALNAINKPIILIAGGRDKGSDFNAIRNQLKHKVKAMVLLGEAKEKIARECADLVLTKTSRHLPTAVYDAFALARSGDCVLLSPMCASFDMFSDYADRGRVFKQAVNNLLTEK